MAGPTTPFYERRNKIFRAGQRTVLGTKVRGKVSPPPPPQARQGLAEAKEESWREDLLSLKRRGVWILFLRAEPRGRASCDVPHSVLQKCRTPSPNGGSRCTGRGSASPRRPWQATFTSLRSQKRWRLHAPASPRSLAARPT